MSVFAKLGSNSILYLLGGIVNGVCLLTLLPILTRNLSLEEYGQVVMFVTLVSSLPVLIDLCVHASAVRHRYDAKPAFQAIYVWNMLVVITANTLIILLAASIYSAEIASLFLLESWWVPLSVACAALASASKLILGQLQAYGDAFWYFVLQSVQALLVLIFTVYLLFISDLAADSRPVGLLMASLCSVVFCLGLAFRRRLIQPANIRLEIISDGVRYGGGLVPHTVGILLLASADRWIVGTQLGVVEVATYAVSAQLASALGMIFDALNKAYVPTLFAALKHGRHRDLQQIVALTYAFVLLCGPVLMLLCSLAALLLNIVAGEAYLSGARTLQLMFTGHVLGGVYLLLTGYIFYSKRTAQLSMVTIVSGAVTFTAMLLMVKDYGAEGVAAAFAGGQLARVMMVSVLAHRSYAMPWGSPWVFWKGPGNQYR